MLDTSDALSEAAEAMMTDDVQAGGDHLPGCPAALSVPGAREECRCGELADLFQVPRPEECFADSDPARARARWRAVHAEAEARRQELMHELRVDEERALARFRELAADDETLERHIRTARELLMRKP